MREMKDSGVPWIGEIPKGWRLVRLKTECELHGRIGWNGLRSEEFEENSYAFLVTGQDFKGPEIAWDKCFQIRKERYDEDPCIQLSNGDLLVTKDGTIGKVAIVANLTKPACLNSGIFVVRQKQKSFYPRYLFWVLSSPQLKLFNDYTNAGGSTIIHLYQNVFQQMPLTIPPIEEQRCIADFLDAKCAEIDTILEKTRASIEEYKKLKQSVITEVVTKGVRGERPMKESGVEWIGEIPAEWEVSTLGRLSSSVRNGYVGPTRDLFVEDGIRYIQSLHIKEGMIDFSRQEYFVPREWASKRPKIKTNNLLIVQTGDIGQVALVTDEYDGCNCHALIIVDINENLVFPLYLTYYLRSHVGKELLLQTKTGALLPHLNSGRVVFTEVCLPTIVEQQEIAAYLDEKCAAIDSLIASKEALISELEAYKKSLIYEYVTGKKEVK